MYNGFKTPCAYDHCRIPFNAWRLDLAYRQFVGAQEHLMVPQGIDPFPIDDKTVDGCGRIVPRATVPSSR